MMNIDDLLRALQLRRDSNVAAADQRASNSRLATRPNRRGHRRRSRIESLESRQLMAGDYEIRGSALYDSIQVSQEAGNLIVDGNHDLTVYLDGLEVVPPVSQTDQTRWEIPTSASSIKIDAYLGEDTIHVGGTIDLGPAIDFTIIGEQITVQSSAQITAGDLSLHSVGAESGLSVASNLPIDLADVFLSDRFVNIEDNVSLTGKDITLNAERISSLVSPVRPIGVGKKATSVSVGSATITASGDVEITSEARDKNIDTVVPEVISGYTHEALHSLFPLAPLPMPVSVMVRESESTVTIESATITANGTVKITSDATADATTYAIAGMQFGTGAVSRGLGTVAVGVSISDASAQTSLKGSTSIVAAGTITIGSNADSIADVQASATNDNSIEQSQSVEGPLLKSQEGLEEVKTKTSDSKAAGAAAAVSVSDSVSHTQIDSGVVVTSTAGSINVNATGIGTNNSAASVGINVDATVALGFAIAVDNADIQATVAGKLTAAGTFRGVNLNNGSVPTQRTTIHAVKHGFETGDPLNYEAIPIGDSIPSGDREAFPLPGLTNGESLFVVKIDQDNFQVVRQRSIDLATDTLTDNASEHSIFTTEVSLFDPATAVNLTDNTITLTNDQVRDLSAIQDGFVLSYQSGSDDDNEPQAIGGLADRQNYIVVNRSFVPGSNSTKIRFQLAGFTSQNDATPLDLTGMGVGNSHGFVYAGAEKTFVPTASGVVDSSTDQIKVPGHGLQTGDEINYRTDADRSSTQRITQHARFHAVDEANRTLVMPGHVLFTGQAITYHAGVDSVSGDSGIPSAGLVDGSTYYVISYDAKSIQLANTLTDAFAGTARTLLAAFHDNENQSFSYETKATEFDGTRATALVDAATNRFIIPGHGLTTGTLVNYEAGDNRTPGAIVNNQNYYVLIDLLDPDRFGLSTSRNSLVLVDLDDSATIQFGEHVLAVIGGDLDVSDNEIAIPSHKLYDGVVVRYRHDAGDIAIGGLTDGMDYEVLATSGDSLQLRPVTPADGTPADGTPDGGTPADVIELSAAGIGDEHHFDVYTDNDPSKPVARTLTFVPTRVQPPVNRLQFDPTAGPVINSDPVDPTTNLFGESIRLDSHGFETGEEVTYLASGGMIGGLTAGNSYTIEAVDADHIRLTTTATAAVVDLTGPGPAGSRHAFEVAAQVIVRDPAIDGLVDGGVYYATVIDENSIRLSASKGDAINATPITLDAIPVATAATTTEHRLVDPQATEGVSVKASLTAANSSTVGATTGGAPS